MQKRCFHLQSHVFGEIPYHINDVCAGRVRVAQFAMIKFFLQTGKESADLEMQELDKPLVHRSLHSLLG